MKFLTIEIYKDNNGEWRWRMIARNGRIVGDSAEGYKTKSGVERAVDRILISRFRIKDDA